MTERKSFFFKSYFFNLRSSDTAEIYDLVLAGRNHGVVEKFQHGASTPSWIYYETSMCGLEGAWSAPTLEAACVGLLKRHSLLLENETGFEIDPKQEQEIWRLYENTMNTLLPAGGGNGQ